MNVRGISCIRREYYNFKANSRRAVALLLFVVILILFFAPLGKADLSLGNQFIELILQSGQAQKPLVIKNATNDSLFVVDANGSIGIGIEVPKNKLNVIGDINATGSVYGTNALCIGADCKTAWSQIAAGTGPWDNSTQIFVRSGYPLYVNISNTIFINGTSGRAGIGTANPLASLHNDGGFITKDPWVDVRAFGADPLGINDSTSAIQAAIDYLPASGGHVLIPAGKYNITNTINLGDGSSSAISTKRGISLIGVSGSGAGADESIAEGPTQLLWYGASGGTIVRVKGPISAVTIENLYFDARGSAATALDISHAFNSFFRKLFATKYTGMAFRITAYSNATGAVNGACSNSWENIKATDPSGPSAGGIEIGSNETPSSPFLDVCQNTFISSYFMRSANVSATSILLRFVDASTFVGVTAQAYGGSSSGNSIEIIPPTGKTQYPSGITFVNSPLMGNKTVSGSWTGSDTINFMPLPVGDDSSIPNHAKFKGFTSDGQFFGNFSFVSPVGIGTTGPNAMLEINASSDANAEQLRLNNPSNGASATQSIQFIFGGGATNGAAITQGWSTNAYLSLSTGGSEVMRLKNGNVGIGTTNPQQKLDVVGTVNVTANIIVGITRPASPVAGTLYFNSTWNTLQIFDGAYWRNISMSAPV